MSKISSEAGPKSAWASVLVPAIFGLVGALIGGGVTAYTSNLGIAAQRELQVAQFDRDQDRLLREKRQPYYDAYNEAVQVYATHVAIRHNCETQKSEACRYSREDMQTARYNLQGAINDIFVFGSAEMQAAVILVGKTMPSPLVGLTGELKVGPVDAPAFSRATNAALKVTCFDLSPAPQTCTNVG